MPRALVFLLSSCGPYLHPGVQRRRRRPGGERVSGPGRMERVPEGSEHLWSYRHAGEINTSAQSPPGSEWGFLAFVCGPGACRPLKDRPLAAAAPAPFAPDPSPDLRWLCVVQQEAIFSQITRRMLSDRRGGCSILLIPPPHSFPRLTYLPPSACSCLKTSLGALLLTSSSSPAHPLFIPQPAFTFDKETVQSLFSLPLLACCYYGDL